MWEFYRNVDKVDATMDEVRTQLELTNEISEAISNVSGIGIDVSFPLVLELSSQLLNQLYVW